jgi:Concanavalin A-like lectin/glucanases superfamily
MIIGNGVQFGNGVQVQNFNPSTYYNTGSVLFNGSSQYLTTPITTNLNLGSTTSYTVECWVNISSFATASCPIAGFGSDRWTIEISATTTNVVFGGAGATNFTLPATITTGTWNHIALVGNAGGAKLYLNGVVSATANTRNLPSLTAGNGNIYIGQTNVGGFNFYMNGYVSNVRLINGVSLYTANFTPSTTPLLPVAGTALLTCQSSSTITDASSNAFSITNTGSAVAGQTNPFGATVNPGSIASGSTAFNGSSQSLKATLPTALGTNVFTLEFWAYPTSFTNNANPAFVDIRTSGSDTAGFGLYFNGGQLNLRIGGSDNRASGYALTLNAWNHVAIVRNSGNIVVYVNGVAQITVANSSNFSNTGLFIGTTFDNYFIQSYISNLRVVNGTAVYTAAFTPPTTPLQAIANTSLLTCQSSTSATTDSSSNALTITNTGTAVATTANPFLGGSTQFNGSSQYLTAPANANLTLSGNFTVEGWVYLNSVSAAQPIMAYGTSGTLSNLLFLFNPTVGLRWYYSGGTTDINQGSTAGWASNTWYHIAAVRNGSTITLYRNGISVASGTASTTYGSGFTLSVGGSVGDSVYFNGNISNFRVVNGTAVYTAAFTPSTTPLTAIANTSLLTCQSSTSATTDASTNAFTITNNGTAVATGLSPFAYPAVSAVTPTVVQAGQPSGSVSLNGSTQYLTAPTNAAFNFGTGSFTIEFWLYCTTAWTSMNNPGIAGQKTSDSTNGWQIYKNGGLDQMNVRIILTNDYPSTATPTTGVWQHWALVRNGTTLTWYCNGVASGSYTGVSGNISDSGNFNIGYTQMWGGYFGGGYISNLRIVKGTALYTSAFTPPAQPLPVVTNTALLTCQSQTSATTDATGLNTITNNGTALAVTASPFHN